MGKVQSQTRSKGRKRKEVPFHPTALDLRTLGNPGLRFPWPSQQNLTDSLKFSE